MSVRIIHDHKQDMATMYCSTSMFAFGPVFHAERDLDAEERCQEFLRWLNGYSPPDGDLNAVGARYFQRDHDPRGMTDAGCERAYIAWRESLK